MIDFGEIIPDPPKKKCYGERGMIIKRGEPELHWATIAERVGYKSHQGFGCVVRNWAIHHGLLDEFNELDKQGRFRIESSDTGTCGRAIKSKGHQ